MANGKELEQMPVGGKVFELAGISRSVQME
jgi:hypothetical protein